MNSNEEYFVSLISSHLNNMPPETHSDIDWEEIYRLSNIHNVCAIVTNQIMLMAKDKQPEKDIITKFRQQLGYTLIDYDDKNEALEFLRDKLTAARLDFLLVKGAVLRDYYPVKEYRTSGDIDVIINYRDIDRCREILCTENIKITDTRNNYFAFKYKSQNIEIHTNLDMDHPYFENIFDTCKKDGCEYKISDEVHLLYVLCHIVKHFNLFGAGIKMFMDVDVLIRHMKSFHYDDFLIKCRELNIETFAKSCFSLCNFWFNTPIKTEIDFNNNVDFRKLFEDEIINSGSFGFNKRDLGNYYINKGIGKSGKNNIFSKIRAFFAMLFPSKSYIQNKFKYLEKYPFLLPFAWFHRLFLAVFVRTKHSKGTIKSIMNSSDESEQYKKLLNELGI
ncbi:MAG: nucleotidyltransferase family protein [Eubacterium sp.]|nr:nucleotidyltransferase family protein [Eubacterium sp.]